MPPSIEDRVRALQARIAQAQGQRARVEIEHEQAQAAAEAARARLREEFGVSTPEEARALLADLTKTLETELARVESALERTAP